MRLFLTLIFWVSLLLCFASSRATGMPKGIPAMPEHYPPDGDIVNSPHCVAQTQSQVYPCPECEFPISDKDVSPNIRTENKCPNCGKVFFGKPEIKSYQSYQKPKGPKGPKVFGRGYYSDIEYNHKVNYSVKNDWDVSPDGNSGSMSQTSIRTYGHTTKGERGTTVGPAGFGRYSGY